MSEIRLTALAAQMFLVRHSLLGAAPAVEVPYRGFVESFDASLGVRGWIAGSSAFAPPELELCIDDECVATARATQFRPDIWDSSRRDILAGFAFAPELLLAAAVRTDVSTGAALTVRPRSTDLCLTSESAWCFSDLKSLVLETSASHYEEAIGLSLLAEFRRLALLARRSFLRPLATDAKKQVGMIEFVCRLPGPYFIVGGWMRATQPTTCAVVQISDGVKHAGALCCITHPRPDLPGDVRAFTGILHIEQDLELDRSRLQWAIYFAGQSAEWLASVQPLRIVDSAVAFAELKRATAASSDIRAAELDKLARDSLPWDLEASGGQHIGIKVGLDECIVAPGFGVFLTGWILCPMGELVGISAKFGGSLGQLDPLSLCLTTRADLAGVFPAYADRLRHAGVTAILRGPMVPDPREKWMLRFDFDSGASHVHEVSIERARVIDSSFDLARLQAAVPGFEAAPWLAEFVDSVFGTAATKARAALHWICVEPADAALVMALPAARSQLTMALDNFESKLMHLAAGAGAVLVLPASSPSGLVASWLRSIRSRHPGIALSACRLAANGHAWCALPDVLRHCGIARFVVVGPEAVLTELGGQVAGQLLRDDHGGLVYLAVEHIQAGSPRQCHESMAFAWQTGSFVRYMEHAPALVGTMWRHNGMPQEPTAQLRDPLGRPHAIRLSAYSRSELIDTINERVSPPIHRPGSAQRSSDLLRSRIPALST